MPSVREQLAAKLQDGKVRVVVDDGEGCFTARVFDGDAAAEWMLAALGEVVTTNPSPAAADAELAVIARMVTDLDAIADALPGRPAGSAWRVLHYLADRYGYVLATED